VGPKPSLHEAVPLAPCLILRDGDTGMSLGSVRNSKQKTQDGETYAEHQVSSQGRETQELNMTVDILGPHRANIFNNQEFPFVCPNASVVS
jgi:hypothetical protein